MFRRLGPWGATILGVVLASAWFAFPLKERISLGLDLQGGMHLLLKVDTEKVPEEAREDAPERALEVIRNRIDEFGVKEPIIHRQGDNEIVVQLPGVTDRDRALEIIGRTAHLEFKVVVEDPEQVKQAVAGSVPPGLKLYRLEEGEPLLLKEQTVLSGDALTSARVQFDQARFNAPIVGLRFNAEGARKFGELTAQNVGRRLAIVLDGKVQSAPRIQEAIPGGEAVITGRFTPQEAADLALVLRVGALPAPVYIEEERTVGPLLGFDSIRAGVRATGIGLVAIFAFMAAYYLLPGLIANVALALNFLIILGGLGLFGATLTLPGIAGILLTLGMAVDANVLIYERIREELKLQRGVRQAIVNGYDRALTAILDANVTTLIAAFLLFQFGTGPIRGFAVTTVIGLCASLFTAIVVTRVILEGLRRGGWLTEIRMLRLIGETRFDFIRVRAVCFALSLLAVIGGMGLFLSKGEQAYGIDFTGGQLQQYHFERAVPIDQVRAALQGEELAGASLQRFGSANEILIRTAGDTVKAVEERIERAFPESVPQLVRVEQVGPSVGQDLRRRAQQAILWAVVGISVYVGIRFRSFSFGVAAILALFHDVLITLGALAVTGRPLSLTLVAALLAIAGYSVNDTIVIYDRIRELRRTVRKTPFPQLINLALNQTLSRTVLTTLTTLLAVLALLFFGGQVLNDFAFALLIGMLSGIYSTIYIATPLLLAWQGRRGRPAG